MSDGISSGNTIIDGIATILWGDAWARAYEEAGGNLSGVKIEDVMPPVPMAAIIDAARLAGRIEERNGVGLYALLWRAAEADARGNEARREELFGDPDYETRFGECLAWEGTGNGVSWFDDHERFELDLPLFEPSDTVDAAQSAVENDETLDRSSSPSG